jgi:effector-binding domain-containing protein
MKITEPKLEDRKAQRYVGIRTQATMQEMGTGLIPRLHQEVFVWLKKQGVTPGAPFLRYHVINMESKLDIEMGWPVASALEGDGRSIAGVLPAGRYAALVYTGLKNGMKANKALLDWGAQKGLVWDRWEAENGDAFGARLESYLTDPADEPDPAKWEIEVAIRLADDYPQ